MLLLTMLLLLPVSSIPAASLSITEKFSKEVFLLMRLFPAADHANTNTGIVIRGIAGDR